MTFWDSLKHLLEPEKPPEKKVDTWPNEHDAGYYDTGTGVNVLYNPPTTGMEDYAPTVDKNIPYRGANHHGVDWNVKDLAVIPLSQKYAEDLDKLAEEKTTEPEPFTSLDLVEPIPVVVRQLPEPQVRENQFATAAFTFLTATDAPIRIAQNKQDRIKIQIRTDSTTQFILLGRDPQTVRNGFLVNFTMPVELVTTEEVWACPTAALASPVTITVLEEYMVSRVTYGDE